MRAHELKKKKDDPAATKQIQLRIGRIEQRLKSFKDKPRHERRIIIVEEMRISYIAGAAGGESGGAAAAAGTGEKAKRQFRVAMTVRTPLRQNVVNDMLGALRRRCETNAQAEDLKSVRFHELSFVYRSAADRPAAGRPVGTVDAGRKEETWMSDPIFEDMADDTRFEITVILSAADDGLGLGDDEADKGGP